MSRRHRPGTTRRWSVPNLAPRRSRPLLAVALTALVVTACSSGATGTAGSAATPAASRSGTAATGSTPPSASAPTGGSPAAATVPVAVRITSGKVDPPVHRVTVPLGARVDLTVTSDVADAVHVHGYDFEKTLPAGAPATLSFTADQPGLFEVETHETGLQLVQLVVR